MGIALQLEFIDFRLFWEGRIIRSDLTDQFGISAPQASTDLARYQELVATNLTYGSNLGSRCRRCPSLLPEGTTAMPEVVAGRA